MESVNMAMPDGLGYAVASSKAEMAALKALGYACVGTEPAFEAESEETDAAGHTTESVRAALDAAGIEYDKRLGLAKLVALLPA